MIRSGSRTAALMASAVLATTAIGGCGDDSPRDPAPSPTAAAVASAPGGSSSTAYAAPTGSPTVDAAPSPTIPAASSVTVDHQYLFPVSGKTSYGRTHHDYPATDIIAACGLPVRAVIDGTILEVSRVDTFDRADSRGEDRGGLSFSLLGADGVRYYGSHLSVVADGIEAGVKVDRGRQLGTVGRTGNANNTCHLHFGVSPPCQRTGDWWTRRGVLYPWRYLDAWRAGKRLSPVAEVANWQRVHGCPSKAPAGA